MGKLKKSGLKTGVPDIFIARAERGFHGAFLEFKTKTGRVSPEQLDWLSRLSLAGYQVQIVRNLDQAIRFVDWYLEVKI